VPRLTVRIASQISSTTPVNSASSSPCAMTRMTGSVPELRITSRPAVPSRASPSAIACFTRRASSGRPLPNRTLRNSCGTGGNTRHTSLARLPVSTIAASTCKAAIKPSPVVA